jgi:putative transposase
MNEALRCVFMRLHYPIEVILVCIVWYVVYPLSLRQLEEMLAERGVAVDHSTIHRWAIKMAAHSFCSVPKTKAPGRKELA